MANSVYDMVCEMDEQKRRFNDRPELYKLARFAPGDYWCRCADCGRVFNGDKRASRCFDCASVLVQKNS